MNNNSSGPPDVTMTHDHCGRTTQHTNGALTHRVSSTGAPQSDGVLNKSVRLKIRHYRQIYEDSPDPIVFLSITVSTSGRVYEDFERLFFLHSHRETSILSGELPEESEQFRSCRVSRLANLKGSVGSILTKSSPMWVTVPIDLSTWSFIPSVMPWCTCTSVVNSLHNCTCSARAVHVHFFKKNDFFKKKI